MYLRKGKRPGDVTLVALNFTPVPRDNYQIGVPRGGSWRERLNSDAQGLLGQRDRQFRCDRGVAPALARPIPFIDLRLPPLAVLVLTPE